MYKFAAEDAIVPDSHGHGYPFALLCISISKICLAAVRNGALIPPMNSEKFPLARACFVPVWGSDIKGYFGYLGIGRVLHAVAYLCCKIALPLTRPTMDTSTTGEGDFFKVANKFTAGVLLEFHKHWRSKGCRVETGDFQSAIESISERAMSAPDAMLRAAEGKVYRPPTEGATGTQGFHDFS